MTYKKEFFEQKLSESDKDVSDAIQAELKRQQDHIELNLDQL